MYCPGKPHITNHTHDKFSYISAPPVWSNTKVQRDKGKTYMRRLVFFDTVQSHPILPQSKPYMLR